MSDLEIPSFFAAVAIVLGIVAFTGSSCQQNADKLMTERASACVESGGQWFNSTPEMCLRER